MKMYDDKYIVVTGAAGFIGVNLIRELNQQGFKNLILVDDLGKSMKWKYLVGTHFVELISKYQIFDWLSGREEDVEAFIHLGACSDTVEDDGDFLLENNTQFSIRLAEYALTNGHRFIYASSAATYGDGSKGFSDEHDRLESLEPLNLYGFSKHMIDIWMLRQGVLNQVVGLKYFNIFGPYEETKGRMASMVYHMSEQIKKTGKVSLFKSSEPAKYEDGGQVRDFLYVKDAVKMSCSFLHNDLGGIYNVGRGEPNTWNALALAVFKGLGKQVNIEYIPMPEDLIGKYQNYTCADMSKWKEKPLMHSLEEGVIDALKTRC
ncbi:MAG: ADP-glyceromanno-heptose 6-epimerase [Simkaniaceae bacterium]|nr:ADP-glyceromanno-heptose 6-epimerase [Simkaniaceae bacterium]